MVSRRPVAGSALGRGQRSGWEGVAEGAAQGRGASHSHRTWPLGERAGFGRGAGTVTSSPQDPGPSVWQTPPHSVPLPSSPPLSLLSDRTLACRCSTTCRQTLSFWLAGWRCWRRSSGQVTLRHPHPQLRQPSLAYFSLGDNRKLWNVIIFLYFFFFLLI